jgi:hypothetical protein
MTTNVMPVMILSPHVVCFDLRRIAFPSAGLVHRVRVTTKVQCLPFHRAHEILVRRHFGPDTSREAMQTLVWGRLSQVH